MAYLSSEFLEEGYLEALEKYSGVGQDTVMGRLTLLWHTSQRNKKTCSASTQILAWGRVKLKAGLWIPALLKVGLLKQIDDDMYEIIGNAKRLGYIEARHESAKKAANTRWEPLRLVKEKDASRIANALPLHSGCNPTTTTTTTELPPVCPPRGDGPSAQDLVAVWNNNRKSLPGCRPKLNDKRLRHVNARLREEPDLEKWTACVKAIANTPWCNGKNNTGWTADFGYLVQVETMTKFEEGRYGGNSVAEESLYDSIDLPEVLT
jgi:hypothetical protein